MAIGYLHLYEMVHFAFYSIFLVVSSLMDFMYTLCTVSSHVVQSCFSVIRDNSSNKCNANARKSGICDALQLESADNTPTALTVLHDAPMYQTSAKLNNPLQSYCDLYVSNFGAVRHLAFDQKWMFTIPPPPGTHSEPACQTLIQLANRRLRYMWFNTFSLFSVTFLGGQLRTALFSDLE